MLLHQYYLEREIRSFAMTKPLWHPGAATSQAWPVLLPTKHACWLQAPAVAHTHTSSFLAQSPPMISSLKGIITTTTTGPVSHLTCTIKDPTVSSFQGKCCLHDDTTYQNRIVLTRCGYLHHALLQSSVSYGVVVSLPLPTASSITGRSRTVCM
jgi:hypothetical protein